MQVGTKLKIFRESKKLTQQEIADYLDISQKTYSNMESDKTTPSLTHIVKLSKLLEFNILDILKQEGITFNQNNSELKDNSGSYIVNNFSEKLIEQYEARLLEKEKVIQLLEEKIKLLQNLNK